MGRRDLQQIRNLMESTNSKIARTYTLDFQFDYWGYFRLGQKANRWCAMSEC